MSKPPAPPRKLSRRASKPEEMKTAEKTVAEVTSSPFVGRPKEKPLHPLEELFGKKLLAKDRSTVSPQTFAVDGSVIGVYFAAAWCPPCRVFSPQLALLQHNLKAQNKQLEIIFVSFDYNEQHFLDYFTKMPWYAIDFTDCDKREEVAVRFGIRGIPALILLDAVTVDIITMNGREVVLTDPLGDHFPWKPDERKLSRGAPSGHDVVSPRSSASSKGRPDPAGSKKSGAAAANTRKQSQEPEKAEALGRTSLTHEAAATAGGGENSPQEHRETTES